MHSSTMTTTLALLLPFSSAIITGIHVPHTISPGTTVPVTLITANYIQSVEDVAIAFGISAADTSISFNESVGSTLLNSTYLGPDKSNVLGNISVHVDLPGDFPEGGAVFNGVLYSLYGVDYEPVLKNFTVEVVVEEG